MTSAKLAAKSPSVSQWTTCAGRAAELAAGRGKFCTGWFIRVAGERIFKPDTAQSKSGQRRKKVRTPKVEVRTQFELSGGQASNPWLCPRALRTSHFGLRTWQSPVVSRHAAFGLK